MAHPFNPLDYPTCLMQPAWAPSSPWTDHVPFLFALVEMLRPRTVVVMGDAAGVSSCALCQAVDRTGLSSRVNCLVAGPVVPGAWAELKAHHDPRYGRFSSLTAGAAADACGAFADGSIDLLLLGHAVAPQPVHLAFENWLPKMSERGVLLVQGVGVPEADHGARELWAGVRGRHPSFEFTHGSGLGVLAVGPTCPDALGPLLSADEREVMLIREFYCQLGRRILQEADHRRLQRDNQDLLTRLAETEQLSQVYRLQCEERDELLQRATAELEPIQRSLALRCVKLLARMEWALAPAGSRLRSVLHLARTAARGRR